MRHFTRRSVCGGADNKGFLGLMVRGTVFAANCEFQQKKGFQRFYQPLRIFSGGLGIGLFQILTVLSVVKCHWTEIAGFA